MGFVTVGENENHALAEFSKSLDSIKINAKNSVDLNVIYHTKAKRAQCRDP
jgi:hypothetical protein